MVLDIYITALEMSNSTSQNNSNKMATDTKTKKSANVKKTETVSTAPVVPVAPVAPVVEEKKAGRGRKPAVKTESSVPIVEKKTVEVNTLSSVADRIRDAQSRFTAELKEIAREAAAAAKDAAKKLKDAGKKKKVKKNVDEMTPEEKANYEARRANNAFLKPRPLTPELCGFLSIPAGSQRSQTEVTKQVSAYVKAHGCFDPANKRRIIPDGALSKLLKVTDKDAVTYLNLQSFLKAHFIKSA
jgi:chromatin remodeling complex protein RSC6